MNWTGLIIFLAILAAPFVWAITIYNGLVALRNRFKNAFAQKGPTPSSVARVPLIHGL